MSESCEVPSSSEHAGTIDRVRRRARERYAGSFAERFWSRLTVNEFMTKAMVLAAIALLCFIPFVLTAAALTGRDAIHGMARRLGLNPQAAHDFVAVFAPAKATSAAVSGAGYVLFIIGGIAFASAIQDLYQGLFDLEPRGLRTLPHKLLWLATIFVCSWAVSEATRPIQRATGDVVVVLLAFVACVIFWWYTPWLLLAGRERWRDLVPVAIATGVCWVGMLLVFRLVFSNSIIGDYQRYGPVGVVFAMMSFFIAIGVVISLGAVSGLVWREARHPELVRDGSKQAANGAAEESPVENGDGDFESTQEVKGDAEEVVRHATE